MNTDFRLLAGALVKLADKYDNAGDFTAPIRLSVGILIAQRLGCCLKGDGELYYRSHPIILAHPTDK